MQVSWSDCCSAICVFLCWQDIGPVAYGFRLLEKLVDLNALFTLAAPLMHLMPDFQEQLAALRSSTTAAAAAAVKK